MGLSNVSIDKFSYLVTNKSIWEMIGYYSIQNNVYEYGAEIWNNNKWIVAGVTISNNTQGISLPWGRVNNVRVRLVLFIKQ